MNTYPNNDELQAIACGILAGFKFGDGGGALGRKGAVQVCSCVTKAAKNPRATPAVLAQSLRALGNFARVSGACRITIAGDGGLEATAMAMQNNLTDVDIQVA